MKPQQVVAIGLFKTELIEAPPGFLKIIMDASDMKFLDASFDTTTAFFCRPCGLVPAHCRRRPGDACVRRALQRPACSI